MSTFNTWFDSTGSKALTDISAKVVSTLASAVEAGAEPMLKAGASLGLSLGSGLWEGLQKKLAEHPLLAMAASTLVGAKTGGWIGAGVGFLTGFGASAVSAHEQKKKNKDYISPEQQSRLDTWILMNETLPGEQGYRNYKEARNRLIPNPADGSHAGGLGRVPYNGYRAILHKDETVLTKGQADARRENRGSSGGGNGPLFIVQTMNVRKESDIDDIASKLADMIGSARGARSIG
jgi:hypothetical protein